MIHEKLKEIIERDAEIKLPDFKGPVRVRHQDGSTFSFYNGVIVEEDIWVIVFSEHSTPMLWHKEDLETWGYIERPQFMRQGGDLAIYQKFYDTVIMNLMKEVNFLQLSSEFEQGHITEEEFEEEMKVNGDKYTIDCTGEVADSIEWAITFDISMRIWESQKKMGMGADALSVNDVCQMLSLDAKHFDSERLIKEGIFVRQESDMRSAEDSERVGSEGEQSSSSDS